MRGWNRLVKGAVFIGALAGLTTSAFGAAGDTTATVTPLSPEVTYSRAANPPRISALTTYIGYTVVVNNASGNTINNIAFEGTLRITDEQEIAQFSSADGRSCTVVAPTTPGNSITVRCFIGQLQAGRSTAPFALFFVAPLQDETSPTDPDYALFSGRIITAEGGPVVGNSPNDSVDLWSAPDVKLGTPNARLVMTAVPKSGGSFFTGDGAVPGLLGGDPFTTTVTVPPSAIIARAFIDETEGLQTSHFFKSWSANLDIIDVSDGSHASYAPALLAVRLRMDSANIVRGTKINDVVITYDGAMVLPCNVKGVLNSPGVPCINESKHYKNRNVAGWTADLDQDMEWTALIDGNGRWTIE